MKLPFDSVVQLSLYSLLIVLLLLAISAFTFFLPISAQVSAPEAIGVKITSPVKGQEVLTTTTATSTPVSTAAPSDNVNNTLIVSGTSTDDVNT